jgi:RND family efflux transporter MFP subunit
MLLAAPWAALAVACARQAPPPAKPATAVVAKPAARRQVVSTVTLTGTVEPERTARLVAQVEGEVELLAVREGDPVRSGQVLVRIDPSRLKAALDEARGDELAVQADLEDARRVLERDRVLFERQGIGKERLEKSETGVQRLEAALARSEARAAGLAAQLADTEVRAPFDGYVLERRVELGDVVKSGSPLLSIASRQAHVLVQVAEMDLTRLHLGDEVRLAVDSSGGEPIARISRIRPQVDPATRTAAVEVVPTADAPRLLPGMLVRVTLTLARRNGVLAAPADAVLTRPDGSRTLFVVEGDTAVQRKVSTGLEGGGWVEVLEGLKEGELVVLQGQERLKDGAPVAIKGTGEKGKKEGPPKDQAAAPGKPSGGRPPGEEGAH